MELAPALPSSAALDHRSFVGEIVRQSGRQLRSFIRARVPSEADTEDILQEVWHQLIATLEQGPIERVGGWLHTVARNRIIDRYRKPRMASLEAMAAEDDADETGSIEHLLRDDRTPISEARRHHFWEQMRAALHELPAEQRAVFVWHELEGLSFRDIAALTGENQNTLLSRKRYAVLHLRQRLGEHREEYHR